MLRGNCQGGDIIKEMLFKLLSYNRENGVFVRMVKDPPLCNSHTDAPNLSSALKLSLTSAAGLPLPDSETEQGLLEVHSLPVSVSYLGVTMEVLPPKFQKWAVC